MWNLTPDYLQQVKEELKVRRAAIEARHAEELKSLEIDLEEIDTLERVAYAVAVKHLPEREAAMEQSEPQPQVVAQLEPAPEVVAQLAPEPRAMAELGAEPVVVDPETAPQPGPKGLSRWRIRLDENSETESA
jgi:hypothetical protein